ncbi:hypothetical protein CCP3SC15_3260002 [Gammaproteobacteria bacterium]
MMGALPCRRFLAYWLTFPHSIAALYETQIHQNSADNQICRRTRYFAI